MAPDRMLRINSLIKQEVSQMLQNHKKQVWSGFVTVTSVQVSRDLRNAKIFVSIMESPEKKERIMKHLKSGSSYYFRQLARNIRLKNIPRLEFVLDEGLEHSAHIFEILERLKKEKDTAHGEQEQ